MMKVGERTNYDRNHVTSEGKQEKPELTHTRSVRTPAFKDWTMGSNFPKKGEATKRIFSAKW